MKNQNPQTPLQLDEISPSTLERIVAVEISSDNEAELFFRTENDKLIREKKQFNPFILIRSENLLQNAPANYSLQKLNSPEYLPQSFSIIAKFADLKTCENTIEILKKKTGKNPSAPDAPYKVFSDYVQQFLISNQCRLFRNMKFCEIRRLQFDIETNISEGYDFPNPEHPDDKIIMIGMKDNRGWEKILILDENNGGEKKLLEDFVSAIIERDPDVIEGYNIFRFDLPFIKKRAEMHGVKLKIGRDGSQIKSRASRLSFAERTISYIRFDVYGRHFADIYFMVQFYDISHRDIEDFSLKAVAKHLGVAANNRTYLEHSEISQTFRENPTKLAEYCLDDVRETASLSEILSPSYFYQTQIIPLSYQNCIVRGNATKIDALLVAEYLRRNLAVPQPEPPRAFEGALTEACESGVFENVWHCDIRSLYPSILLAAAKNPSRDHAGIFLEILSKLKKFRLLAKDLSKKTATGDEKEYYESLQSTFKILINSFYGYLGFAQGSFNDYTLAAAVTATGREILSSMTDFLRKSGARVIEMDTDGIYFQPPPEINSPDEMQKKIQAILPQGIEVELDNTYKSMFSYKSKNYALLSENGEISITGAALKSRGLEPFQREYMSAFIEKLLKKDYNGIAKLNDEFETKIKNREFPLEKLAKTETLQESPESYAKKIAEGKTKRSAAYELAIASKRKYKQGDQISYYVYGTQKNPSVVDNCRTVKDAPNQRDENIQYYLAKFAELRDKFKQFIPENKKNLQQDDLFAV